jgi:hypothetical protein
VLGIAAKFEHRRIIERAATRRARVRVMPVKSTLCSTERKRCWRSGATSGVDAKFMWRPGAPPARSTASRTPT